MNNGRIPGGVLPYRSTFSSPIAPGLVSDDAGQLSSNAGQVSDTAGQLSSAAGQLSDTAGQLSDTARQLSSTAGTGRRRARDCEITATRLFPEFCKAKLQHWIQGPERADSPVGQSPRSPGKPGPRAAGMRPDSCVNGVVRPLWGDRRLDREGCYL
jgi:hypothetical protein